MKNMSRYEIHGVTDGIAARPFIVRIFGKFDAKHGQICREEDKFTSPWILGKKSCCEDFINASYIEAAKKMEKAHRDVIVAVRRLREIEIEKPFPRFAFNEEQRARHEMEEERKEQNNRTEQVNLRMRMAEAMAEVEQTDVEMLHTIECVKAIFRRLVLTYWQGVLRYYSKRKPGMVADLPSAPELMDSHYGQNLYVEKRDSLVRTIQNVIGDEEVTA